ncbi:hypothetical protein BT93_A0186 [Corymbia citriodora subsp. variegata]|nr:hypothetical protein BT93_A0186 [Corymbia citriodora subsp. variegata]
MLDNCLLSVESSIISPWRWSYKFPQKVKDPPQNFTPNLTPTVVPCKNPLLRRVLSPVIDVGSSVRVGRDSGCANGCQISVEEPEHAKVAQGQITSDGVSKDLQEICSECEC